ncbi:hypothetical protein KJ951_04650 [Patescibacteria group bacterium]|nr:hypothetical protein [Patescibacteria group bacterium]MBU1703667.1 hypothetical protein [Patescibacteria group bacterium]MBU1954337.1 hypothetical protein [Patescibacteria group bacterium]
MAKHAVPKYKTPKSKTRTRYSSYKCRQVKKLRGIVEGAGHTFKKAESIVDESKKKKEIEKITRVKA